MCSAQYRNIILRQITFLYYAAPYRIVNVMIDICYTVTDLDDLSLQSHRHAFTSVIEDAVSYLECKVEAASPCSLLNTVNCPEALYIMSKTAGMNPVENCLSDMTERSMSKIMTESYCFCKIFIICQDPCDSPRNLRYLKSMRKPRPVMVIFRCKKDLSFSDKPAESLGMDDAVSVTLIDSTEPAILLRNGSSL